MKTDLTGAMRYTELNDEELSEINSRMHLGLSLEEMLRIKTYFTNLNREPTELELQSLAQAWSEHSGYKSSRNYLKKFIFGLAKEKIFYQGDAGLVSFNDKLAVALKIESHNHPSAIEPYGGAATGVGGILRDILSMGAQPVAVSDVLFFGKRSKKGFPSPRFIEEGVVAGIRDYGNRVGIPTVSGGIFYSNDFVPNVLVNVGCVGIVEKDKVLGSSVSKPGIKLIIAGGKTGRDGIHGVNMASSVIEKGKEDATTVQLGNPIVKEPLIHAVLEANDRGLISALKDLGGGGLSSVIGEMLLAGNMGGIIYLDRVPLKEMNMRPWEIWISESQERMLLAVEEKNVEDVMDIMDQWDVTAAIIGESEAGESEAGDHLKIFYKGEAVMDLDLEFLTSTPLYYRSYRQVKKNAETTLPRYPGNLNKILLKMLEDPNIRTKEFAVRQYDHTVRGSTVIGPFSGKVSIEGPTDASIIRPSWDYNEGLAISHGVNPFYSRLDPYRGAKAAVDEAVRNIVSSGSEPLAMSDCINAGNPEKPEVMGEFVQMLQGLRDSASVLEIPYVSGNVSFYNETGKTRIPTVPTILITGKIERLDHSLTPDLKGIGNPIYAIGPPAYEMGGSLYYRMLGIKRSPVPDSDPNVLKDRKNRFLEAAKEKLILSSHDVSEGGMAVALAEMTIGSGIGMELDFSSFSLRADVTVFSETQSRFVVEVAKGSERRFEEIMGSQAMLLGYTSENFRALRGEERIFDLGVEKIRNKWKVGYQ